MGGTRANAGQKKRDRITSVTVEPAISGITDYHPLFIPATFADGKMQQVQSKVLSIWQQLSPGDVLPLLVAIQNLKRARPDFKVNLLCPAMELLHHHPDISPVRGKLIVPGYDGQSACDKGWSFIQAYHYDLEKRLGFKFPMVETSPRLYLTPQEDSPPPYLPREYALVVSGGKRDLTVKHWGWWNYQKVVDAIPQIAWVQIGHEDRSGWHTHPRLNNCIDMVGKTSIRELMRLIKYAKVLVCGITLPAWIAAAFRTRAVIVCGGREPGWFIGQPNQIYHDYTREMTCGREGRGCWLSRTVRQGDGFFLDTSICHNTYSFPEGLDLKTPLCMERISPLEVASSVRDHLSKRFSLHVH